LALSLRSWSGIDDFRSRCDETDPNAIPLPGYWDIELAAGQIICFLKNDWPSRQPFVGCKDQDQDQQSRVLNVDMEETSSRLASSLGFDIQAATLTD